MKRKRVLAAVLATYGAAWGLTATIGIADARSNLERRSTKTTSTEWSGFSPLPFMVQFSFKSWERREGTYLWVFGYGRVLDETVMPGGYYVF